MKNKKLALGVMALVTASIAGAAGAQTIVFGDGMGGNSGGEYNARLSASWTPVANITLLGSVPSGAGSGLFATFCVERNETLAYNTSYNWALNTGTVNGGISGQTSTNFDPLDSRTALIYSQFCQGSLSGYDYSSNGRTSSANALQAAIWVLEGELPDLADRASGAWGPAFSLSTTERTLAQSFLNIAQTAASGAFYGVSVLNLTDASAGRHQDVLVMRTEVPQLVPLPPAAWSGLGTLAGALLFARVRRR